MMMMMMIRPSLRRMGSSAMRRNPSRASSSSSSPSSSAALLDNQGSLPSLPLPSLEATSKRYLASLEMLLTPEEFDKRRVLVDDLCVSPTGVRLQERLEERSKSQRNWLDQWWEEYGFWRKRSTQAVNGNVGGPLDLTAHWPAVENAPAEIQIARTTLLLYHTLRFWRAVATRTMVPDVTARNEPLCMAQYERAFSTTRVPGITCDHLQHVEGSRHVAVLVRGRIFRLNVLEADDTLVSMEQLARSLSVIHATASLMGDGDAVSALTTLPRADWARLRNDIIAQPGGQEALGDIEESIVTVSLDDARPQSMAQVSSLTLQGDCTNRWYDKSVQLITFGNGLLGMNSEGSAAEAMVYVRCFGDVGGAMVDDGASHEMALREAAREARMTMSALSVLQSGAREVRVPITSEIRSKWIPEARALYTRDLARLSVCAYEQTGVRTAADGMAVPALGRAALETVRLHSDFVVQMALQLALHRVHGRPFVSVAPASTRAFFHGRTDLARTVSRPSVEFTRIMCDPSASLVDRFKALSFAVRAHAESMMAATNALGVDRHLMGLQIVAEALNKEDGTPVPELFAVDDYLNPNTTESHVTAYPAGYSAMSWGGFAPATRDGYGVAYTILDDAVRVVCTSWDQSDCASASRLSDAVQMSLDDVAELVARATAQVKAQEAYKSRL